MNNSRVFEVQDVQKVKSFYKVTLYKTISFIVGSQLTKDDTVHVVKNVDTFYIHEDTFVNSERINVDIDFESGKMYLISHDLMFDASLPIYDRFMDSRQICPSRVFLISRPLLTIKQHCSNS
jgi:hypothetical protein